MQRQTVKFRFVPLTSKYLSTTQLHHDRVTARNFNLPRATKWVWQWYHNRECKISPIGKGEKKEKRKNRAQIYRLVCAICDIPARESRCSLEETKCRPTSAAATRNFVTSLPSCNDALSWISTRFPPVSDRLSIRREWERRRRRERERKLPLSTSLSHASLPRGGRGKKLSFNSIRGANKDDLYA